MKTLMIYYSKQLDTHTFDYGNHSYIKETNKGIYRGVTDVYCDGKCIKFTYRHEPKSRWMRKVTIDLKQVKSFYII